MELPVYQALMTKTAGLKPNLLKGARVLSQVIATTGLAIGLSLSHSVIVWLIGQIVFGVAVLQWFVLLHDFGHNYFFKNGRLNWLFGYISSLFCIVPFAPWKSIHSQHHTWTGWHDLDPTQEGTLPNKSTPIKNRLAIWSWHFSLPTLTLAFSFSNFWNLPRLFRLFKESDKRIHFVFSIVLLVSTYAALIFWVPAFFHIWGLGYFIFLVLSDPLLISQHVHIPQKLSQGISVSPIPVREQDQFTRSLIFPAWVSRYILLSFDRHTLHHVVPRLACYHLDTLDCKFASSIHWKDWLIKAKKTRADVLLFSNNNQTRLNL